MKYTQNLSRAGSPLDVQVPYPWIQLTKDRKFSEKNSSKFKKENLNFLCTRNYLHNIYTVFTTVYIAFMLSIICNLEII